MPIVNVACTEVEARVVRPVALAAFEEERRRWPFLSDVFARTLRGTAEADRAVAAAVVQALVKYDRLLAFAAGSEDASACFDALFALVGDGAARTALDERLARIERRTERLGVAFSFPDWIVDRVGEEVGADGLERALARMNEIPPRTVRANALRGSGDDLARALAGEGVVSHATSHARFGLVLEGRRSPFATHAFASGGFELQDEASQMVAELVAPPPGGLVVDACAGAGGKALALAALLGGKGRVVAVDTSEDKLLELRRRARRSGTSNVQAVLADVAGDHAANPALAALEGKASRVLLDAPCSGVGAVRRNPEARWRLRPDDLSRLVEAQAALFVAAARLVAPRGRLVFATCSFLPSEGERGVERFLASNAAFSIMTVRDVLGRARTEGVATPDGRYLKTWRFDAAETSGTDAMDGFFAAVLRRGPMAPVADGVDA